MKQWQIFMEGKSLRIKIAISIQSRMKHRSGVIRNTMELLCSLTIINLEGISSIKHYSSKKKCNRISYLILLLKKELTSLKKKKVSI